MGKRLVLSLSLSPRNPDAQRVLEALNDQRITNGDRSRAILAWAAAYLDGQVAAPPEAAADPVLDTNALDALLDAL